MTVTLSLDYDFSVPGLPAGANHNDLPPLDLDLTGFEVIVEKIRSQLPNTPAGQGDDA